MRGASRRGRAGARLGLALAGLAAALLLGELLLRLFMSQPRISVTRGLTTPDPPGRYRLTPEYQGIYSNRAEYAVRVRVNRHGLRGPELVQRPGEVRLLALGDSFTFGVGVEEHEVFAACAAAELRAAGARVVALNAGAPGFGTLDEVSWLERHGLALEPDLVVLAVFLGNDLQDALKWRDRAEPDRSPDRPAPRFGRLRGWLRRHSHLYTLLQLRVPLTLQVRARSWIGDPWPPEHRHLEMELAGYARLRPRWLEEAVAATDQALARLVSSGIPVVALLIPSDLQLDARLLRATASHAGIDPATLDPERPRRDFRSLLSRHGVPFLDLTEGLASRYSAGRPLYYRFDRHWTAAGHAAAGEELARFLAARGLLSRGGGESPGSAQGPGGAAPVPAARQSIGGSALPRRAG